MGHSSSSGVANDFIFPLASAPALEPIQLPIKREMRTLSLGAKKQADLSYPTSAE
jgi:hypothetical protein